MLRDRILSGEFRSGERLREAMLAREMMVSRGPVREALFILRSEGLVTDVRNKGMHVALLDLEDLKEIFDLRLAIEGRAAQTIATSVTDTGDLWDVYQRLEAAVASDNVDAVIELDLEFHSTLCRLGGNRRLHQVFINHVPVLETVFRLDTSAFQAALAEMPARHRSILRAIEARDPLAAGRAIESHMTVSERLFADCLIGGGSGSSSAAVTRPEPAAHK